MNENHEAPELNLKAIYTTMGGMMIAEVIRETKDDIIVRNPIMATIVQGQLNFTNPFPMTDMDIDVPIYRTAIISMTPVYNHDKLVSAYENVLMELKAKRSGIELPGKAKANSIISNLKR